MSDLPNGWAAVQLRNVCQLLNGRAYKQDELLETGRYPVLRVGNFFSNRNWYYSNLELDENKYCDKGDLLYAWSASFGPKIWDAGKVIYHYHIWKTEPDERLISKRLLYHWFEWDKENIKAEFGTGSTMIHVTKADMEARNLNLPPLSEQHRIVAKIDSLSAYSSRARQELDRVPKLIERYKAAILDKAFSGELTADWRVSHNLSKPTCVDLGSVATDFSYGSGAKSSTAGDVPVLRMGNIQDGLLDWDNLVFTSDAHEIEKYRLRSGDVLFNRTNSPALVGKTAIYKGERAAIYAGYLIRIRCSEKLLPAFLTFCLNSPAGRNYCWQVKTDGVSQSNINAKKLAAFELPLPTIAEQQEIVQRIETAFSWLEKIATEHSCAAHLLPKLDQAILAKAFRGDLVPQDPNDEPASALLEHIQPQAKKLERSRRARG